MEKGGADPPFQSGNRLRNRRFGEAELDGRARKGAALSDLGEDRPGFEIRKAYIGNGGFLSFLLLMGQTHPI